jgi:hypothetical protein
MASLTTTTTTKELCDIHKCKKFATEDQCDECSASCCKDHMVELDNCCDYNICQTCYDDGIGLCQFCQCELTFMECEECAELYCGECAGTTKTKYGQDKETGRCKDCQEIADRLDKLAE